MWSELLKIRNSAWMTPRVQTIRSETTFNLITGFLFLCHKEANQQLPNEQASHNGTLK